MRKVVIHNHFARDALPLGFSIVPTKWGLFDLFQGSEVKASSSNRSELEELAKGIAERIANPSKMSTRQLRARDARNDPPYVRARENQHSIGKKALERIHLERDLKMARWTKKHMPGAFTEEQAELLKREKPKDARGPNKSTIAKEAVRQLNGIGEMLKEDNWNGLATKYHGNSANNYMKAIKEGGETIPDWVEKNVGFLKAQGWRW